MPWKLTGNNLVKKVLTEHKTLLSVYVNLQVSLFFVNSQNKKLFLWLLLLLLFLMKKLFLNIYKIREKRKL